MENTSTTPILDLAEARRSALIERHRGFLEKADMQGISPDSLLPLFEIADLLDSVLGKILKRKRIC